MRAFELRSKLMRTVQAEQNCRSSYNSQVSFCLLFLLCFFLRKNVFRPFTREIFERCLRNYLKLKEALVNGVHTGDKCLKKHQL